MLSLNPLTQTHTHKHTPLDQIKATARERFSSNYVFEGSGHIQWQGPKNAVLRVLVLFPLQLIFIFVSLFFPPCPLHVVIGFIMKWRLSMLCFHWRSARLIGHSRLLIITEEHIRADPQYPLIACSCVCAHMYAGTHTLISDKKGKKKKKTGGPAKQHEMLSAHTVSWRGPIICHNDSSPNTFLINRRTTCLGF